MGAIFAAVLFVGIAAAQTFTLGTAADPCTGGAVWPNPPDTLASPIPTLRFSSQPFACVFTAAGGGGAYAVEIDFVEPTAFVPNVRLFNVSVTDAWGSQVYGQVNNIDLFTRGAISAAVVIPIRMLAITTDGKIMVSLSTVKRSAVISRVTITPYAPAPDLSGYVPYKGAVRDLDMGSFRIVSGGLDVKSPTPSTQPAGRINMVAGPCPSASEVQQFLAAGFSVSLCADTDGRLYEVILSTGEKVPAGAAPAQ